MNNSDKFLNDRFRWVILLETKDADAFEEDDFMVVNKVLNYFNPLYTILEIESLIGEPEYTVEDVIMMTGALAAHEEWTNGVVVPVDELDTVADDIYPWEGSGGCFLGDMLTSLEKLHFLMLYLYDQKKEVIQVEDITIREKKDGPKLPLADRVDELFTADFHSIQYKDLDVVLWWQTIIEERGMFLVVLDADLLEDEDEDDEKKTTIPYKSPYRGSEYWGNYYDDVYGYDDYDYDDRYYRRT